MTQLSAISRQPSAARLLAAVAGLMLSAGAARAADEAKPKPGNPAAAADVQDVIYFGKARPVLIRLHLLVDGKPFSRAWDDHVKHRFEYADRNKDGYIDKDEIKLVPAAAALRQLAMSNQVVTYTPQQVRLETSTPTATAASRSTSCGPTTPRPRWCRSRWSRRAASSAPTTPTP